MFFRSNTIKYLVFTGATVLALLAFRFGYHLAYGTKTRNPAAIERMYDFSALMGDELTRATHNRIIEALKIVTAPGGMGVELGSFQMKNALGEVVSACEEYQSLEFHFVASGMSVSGEPPVMIVRGPCIDTEYTNRISALIIPLRQLYGGPVIDQDIKSTDAITAQISIQNISDSWPHTWILNSLSLIGPDGKSTVISQDEIKNISGKHVALEWQQ